MKINISDNVITLKLPVSHRNTVGTYLNCVYKIAVDIYSLPRFSTYIELVGEYVVITFSSVDFTKGFTNSIKERCKEIWQRGTTIH